jgi:tRNA(Ile)-lysidine synthase
MVLLDAMASARGHEVAAVATFDHGTGRAATRAAAMVVREAESRGLAVVQGVARADLAHTEAAWRTARHRFLDGWARELEAQVVTAHTRDDQIETVVLRLLRDSGPRGLAGMLATSTPTAADALSSRDRMRPMLTVSRAAVHAYHAARRLSVAEDPSNARMDHARNRVRTEILPALERVRPGFGAWCWELSVRAAELREGLDAVMRDHVEVHIVAGTAEPSRVVVLHAAPFIDLASDAWAVLWPAVAARAGVVMDRRGITRASHWAPRSVAGQEIQLAGGAAISRTRATFVLRGTPPAAPGYILYQ